LSHGDSATALKACKNLLQFEPDNEEASIMMADLKLQQNDPKAAI
jgi:thioredoxin-like negative regulator of GroEL